MKQSNSSLKQLAILKEVAQDKQIWGMSDLMVTAAFRYCLGRATYIVDECICWMKSWWELWEEHSPHVTKLIVTEIREAIDQQRAGHEMDVKDWERFLKYVGAQSEAKRLRD